MKKQPDLEFQKFLGMIRSHFDFLFQRGYRIVSAMFTDPANQDWNVILAGEDTLIQIRYRNEKVNLALSSEKLFDTVGMLDLYDLVGHIRGEKNLLEASPPLLPDEREQVRKSAQLLENHMEEILTFLQKIH